MHSIAYFISHCSNFPKLNTLLIHSIALVLVTSCTSVTVKDRGIAQDTNNNTESTTTNTSITPQQPAKEEKVAAPNSVDQNNSVIKSINEEAQAPADLWQEIRDGFSFVEPLSTGQQNTRRSYKTPEQRVERYRKRLLASPSLLNNVAKNAEPYLFFVVEELKKNNIPLEIALLPIVESRYDPFAYSPGRAAGLWQFIPATGRRYGLHQDWWQDKRRDTVLATRGAITYLSSLHKRFNNDWLLAMAAYNAGQGNVARAIRKNKKAGKPTDYWSLNLPKETQHYIPKLLAWRDIIQNTEKYNINLLPIANEPHFSLVDIGSQIDLAEAASLADVDIDTIYKLNGSYNRWATDPKAPHLLAVPVEKATILETKLSDIPNDQRLSWQRYIIKKNDSLIKIGKKFNTSPKLIAEVNGVKNNRIRAGKALLIPSASQSSDFYRLSADQRHNKRQNRSPRNKTQKIVHRVSHGENLWDIARRYKVGVKELARWNSMAPGDVLALNKKLVIWTKNTQAAKSSNEKRKVVYTVRKGDSLAHIASRFNVRVRDIKSWNNDANSKYIQPGQSLRLFVDITNRRSFN